MTTTTKEAPAKGAKKETPAALQEPAKTLFAGKVNLDLIDVVSNVRKKFDERALQELAANIKQLGRVISPITLRPGKPGRHELVAGERRLRGAKIAGLSSIDAQVLELNDQQALEYQAAENIHRKDLTPIEEARAFKTMLEARNERGQKRFTVEDLAQIVDKSVVYIYRSVNLLELPKDIVEAIEEGTLAPAHGLQLLRVPADKRAKFAKLVMTPKTDFIEGREEDGEYSQKERKIGLMTAKELQLLIDNEVGTNLDRAQFPREVAYAGEVACSGCPLNAANQNMLFEGAGEQRCLNRPCFNKKTEQFYVDLQAEGKAKWPALEYVGRGKQDPHGAKRSIEGLPGNAMIEESEHSNPIIKKLLAERPHKLGYAVVLPGDLRWDAARRWKKAKLVLVVTDPSLIGGVRTDKIVDCTKPEKAAKKKASRESMDVIVKPADLKAQFISEAVERALGQAGAKAALKAKLTAADWRELAGFLYDDVPFHCLQALLETEDEAISTDQVGKATEDQARAIVLLRARWPYEPSESDYKKVGVDVAAVKKTAKAAAEKLWDERAAAAKADATAGKTARK